jgi:MoaA/NifB/PqqE/SkfB family radical SAM enzyme
VRFDFERLFWHQWFPVLPEGINMNANDICNSKCVMCNIWKQTKDFEFSPEQLQTILSDPLYRKVKYVGITGGEPTLRDDLPELYHSCIKALPSLVHLSIITNGIKDEAALSRILKIKKLCDQHSISFSAMVSLDGVGAMHDQHRGRQGNFDSVIRLNDELKNKGIDVSFGCTVTKGNLYGLNELLAFTKAHQMKGRFRIGEFINRLYITEEENGAEIRNFVKEETYYLQNFFHQLSQDFRTRNPIAEITGTLYTCLVEANDRWPVLIMTEPCSLIRVA